MDWAASRIWQRRGCGSREDVAAARIWQRRGFGRAADGREIRQRRRQILGADRSSERENPGGF